MVECSAARVEFIMAELKNHAKISSHTISPLGEMYYTHVCAFPELSLFLLNPFSLSVR